MRDSYIELMNSIANLQENLIVVFKGSDIILTNNAFNSFFGVRSLKEYKENFGEFVDNFVPHPSYFNKEKIQNDDSWFDAIVKLDELDRVVSILSHDYEPYAFSVSLDKSVDGFIILSLTDITQTLIKRIMIENHANIDAKSGAYSKQYFTQITKSFEDAALFNEKIIALNQIELASQEEITEGEIKEFVEQFKGLIREDDMLVRWSTHKFFLAYLVDTAEKAKSVTDKLKKIKPLQALSYSVTSAVQENKESIAKVIQKLGD